MTSSRWCIRPAGSSDIDVITEFNLALAHETENYELPHARVRAGVENGLKHSPEVQYFMAQLGESDCEESIVGQIMITREWSDWRNGWMMWLQSVYVRPAFRGQGVFRDLLQNVIERFRTDSTIVGVRLYVERDNERAQRAYEKNGFVDPHYVVREIDFTKEVDSV